MQPGDHGALRAGENDRVVHAPGAGQALEIRAPGSLTDQHGGHGNALPTGERHCLDGCLVAFVVVQTADARGEQDAIRQAELAAQGGPVGGRTKNAPLDPVGHHRDFFRGHREGFLQIPRCLFRQRDDMRRPVHAGAENPAAARGEFLERFLLVHDRGDTGKFGRFGREDMRVVRLRMNRRDLFPPQPRGEPPDRPRGDPARGKDRHEVDGTPFHPGFLAEPSKFAQADVMRLEIRREMRARAEGEILGSADRHGGENKSNPPGGGAGGFHGRGVTGRKDRRGPTEARRRACGRRPAWRCGPASCAAGNRA